jgi:hypothetical protein
MSASGVASALSTPPPAVLDIEASGFGAGSYPIEVGFVLADGRAFCTLVRPEPQWQAWDPAAEAVHRIPRAALHAHGRAPSVVTRWLNELLAGQTVYCDGWGHDFAWLHTLYDAAGAVPSFRLESIATLLEPATCERWHAVKAEVMAASNLDRHRASSDAKVLQRTVLALARSDDATADAD